MSKTKRDVRNVVGIC